MILSRRSHFRHAAVFLLQAGVLAAAQHSGSVRAGDQPVPGAIVTAITGKTSLSVVTDAAGKYVFDDLPPGVWLIEVEMFGFTKQGMPLLVKVDATALDWNLELEPLASAPAAPSGFVTLTMRGPANTASAPAAPAEPSLASESFLITGSMSRGLENPNKAQAKDARHAENAQQLAGVGLGFSSAPGIGARGRAYSAKGHSSIGNRKQKNEVRGSAYFSLRNSAMDARPYSLSGNAVAKPSYAQSRFGLTIGGPLKIPRLLEADRTFFYFTYAGTRGRNPYSTVTTLPALAERAGDFSQSVARWPVTVYDPASRLPFPANRIPLDRFNSAARGLLDFIPLPIYAGRVQNFQYTASVPSDTVSYGVRVNQAVSRHDRFDFNVNLQTRGIESSQAYGFRDTHKGMGLSASAGYTHNFGPRTIHNVRWNFSRNRTDIVPFFAFKTNVAAELGIRGVSDAPRNWGPPNLSFTNFGGLADAYPVLRRDQTSTVNDALTLVRKKHTIRAGAEMRRLQQNSLTENGRGSLSFSGLQTSGFDAKNQPLPGTGFDFADFLLGFPQSSSIRFGDDNTYFRAQDYSEWAQDDWRMRPNFTITTGLRYEFFAPYSEKRGRMANLDIAPGFTGVAVVTPGKPGPYTGAFPDALVEPDMKLFSPRTGVAWRPLPKKQLLIRAGYGLFFNGAIYNDFPTRMASQPPFAKTASLSTSTSRPLTLQEGFASAPSDKITNTFALDRNYRVGYAQTWNFSLQQNLPRALVAEVGYLGTKGTRLDLQRLPNRAMPGSPLTAEERRRIGNATGFTFETSIGNSIYHALQVRVTRRFQKGISANVNYTLAKSIDNASTFGGGGNVVAQNDSDLRAERGLSSFDQRHNLTINYFLVSPVGDNGLLRGGKWGPRFLAEWSLSGNLTFTSGTPLTARVLGNLANSGGTGAIGSGRADATGADVHGGPGFFNLQAYTIPPSGRFGNAGRNTVPGPNRIALYLGFGRSFKLGADARHRIELRVESSNVTNHASFTSLGTVVNASNYGLPLATMPMRSVSAVMRLRF